MNMGNVKILVRRWLDERTESDSKAVTSSYTAFGDFIEWWEDQEDRGDGVVASQFGSAMKQMGFGAQKDDDGNWVIRGIKLLED